MSANAIFTKRLLFGRRFLQPLTFRLVGLAAAILTAFSLPGHLAASEEQDVENAVVRLAEPQEKAGFDFRADIWQRELKPDVGKAVRIQFFKGNDYRVCVAVAPKSGVQIAAHVLDAEGKPVETKSESISGGWGVTLHVTPKRTGIYMVVIRQSGGKAKPTLCGMISGYK